MLADPPAAVDAEFDVVLFWSWDRFSREGVLETLQYLKRLSSYGVAFKSFTEQYLGDTGIFKDAIIGILAALAKILDNRGFWPPPTFNSHRPAASAANASGFLLTALSNARPNTCSSTFGRVRASDKALTSLVNYGECRHLLPHYFSCRCIITEETSRPRCPAIRRIHTQVQVLHVFGYSLDERSHSTPD